MRSSLLLALSIAAALSCSSSRSSFPNPDTDGPSRDSGSESEAEGESESESEGEGAEAESESEGGATCMGLASPDTAGAGCSSCTPGGMAPRGGACQENGCYGGWWCNTSTHRCASPPSGCSNSGDEADGGVAPTMPSMWPTTTSGPIRCPSAGAYDAANSRGRCGVWRWPVKTGADSLASMISMTPTPTTIAALTALTPPAAIRDTASRLARQPPLEETVYKLTDVHLSALGMAGDSDYHMNIDDAGAHMIAEIPFPGCVAASSILGCDISRARAAVEAHVGAPGSFRTRDDTVTIVGVGFWDFVHMDRSVPSGSQAANAIEIHPVLAICFGRGCDPLAGR